MKTVWDYIVAVKSFDDVLVSVVSMKTLDLSNASLARLSHTTHEILHSPAEISEIEYH